MYSQYKKNKFDFDYIMYNDEIQHIIDYVIINNNIPHILISGNPGIGKWTFILLVAKILFKLNYIDKHDNNEYCNCLNCKKKFITGENIQEILPEHIQNEIFNNRILFLNASNDRGIKVVRDKIKKFILSKFDNENIKTNFKLIILDEADALSLDSQYALRRIIESYWESTRFILICNY